MTYSELYRKGAEYLTQRDVPSPRQNARELLQHCFGITSPVMMGEASVPEDGEACRQYWTAIKQRGEGYPLQYLLGQWSFMDCPLYVGEGVLIPRDDTEVCVRAVLDYLCDRQLYEPVMADLCSGSGAAAIALAKHCPGAAVTAVELYEQAYGYLVRNIAYNEVQSAVLPMQGDIACCSDSFPPESLDVILSNPPYIAAAQLPTLQREVQYEPMTALNGGDDGLYFYRIIAEKWCFALKSGGLISLEIGEEQAAAVTELLQSAGFEQLKTLQDIQGLDRAVIGIKK